jgi:hypothetical protein
MIILNDEQGTEAWLESRLGKPSASCFSKLITRTGKPSTSAETYINQLIFESLSKEITQGHVSEAMLRGTELEPQARESYAFLTEHEVVEVGFVMNDDRTYGCSPDGLIGDEGGLEIKCPLGATMVKYLRDETELVKAYWQQIQGSMWVTGRQWWDAFAYHPSTPHVKVRCYRDDDYISKLEEQVLIACETIKLEVEKHT